MRRRMMHPAGESRRGACGPDGAEEMRSVRLRLRVSLRRGTLDRELADGRDPHVSAELGLRAMQLTNDAIRRRLACALRGIVAEAERGPRFSAAVPVCRPNVAPWAEGLLGLADVLQRPGAVNPCGVARALAMITDGAGPLYNPGAAQSVGDVVW